MNYGSKGNEKLQCEYRRRCECLLLPAGSPFIVDVEGQMVKEVAIMAKPEVQKISLETRNFRINQQQWILLQAFGSSIEDFSHFQISIIGSFFVSCIYSMGCGQYLMHE